MEQAVEDMQVRCLICLPLIIIYDVDESEGNGGSLTRSVLATDVGKILYIHTAMVSSSRIKKIGCYW